MAYEIGGILDFAVGIGPAFNLSYVSSTGELYYGAGVGISLGHNLSGGVIVGDNISAALLGLSYSFGYNITPLKGIQSIGNSDGILTGNSVGIVGGSAAVTYSGCIDLGR